MGRARSSKCRCLSGKGDPARGSFLFSQSLSSTELHSAPLRKLVREESQSCTTSRPERPLRQGTTPARPATLGLEQAYVGPWAPLPEMGPPLRQSGNLGVLVTSHGHTPLFGDPLAFLQAEWQQCDDTFTSGFQAQLSPQHGLPTFCCSSVFIPSSQ